MQVKRSSWHFKLIFKNNSPSEIPIIYILQVIWALIYDGIPWLILLILATPVFLLGIQFGESLGYDSLWWGLSGFPLLAVMVTLGLLLTWILHLLIILGLKLVKRITSNWKKIDYID